VTDAAEPGTTIGGARRWVISGGTIYTGCLDQGWVLIEDGTIAATGRSSPPESDTVLDATGLIVAPGFVDLHLHGGGGADVMDATPEALRTIARAHAAGGTTGWVGSTVAAPLDETRRVLDAAAPLVGQAMDGAALLGVHLEGPYLSVAQRGAHQEAHLRLPQRREYEDLFSRLRGRSRVTAAPELPGALEMGEAMSRQALHGAIGHSDADLETVRRALHAGYSHVTHLYSCTSGLRIAGGYKTPGIQEASLLFDALTVELIGDGHHVPATLIELVVKVKGPERVCLVTDAMRAAGLGPGIYRLGGSDVLVEDGVAKLPDRSKFAGSVCTMAQAVRTAVAAGIRLEWALQMASGTPATLLGLGQRKGAIAPGMDADLVLLDGDLMPRLTIADGRIVYRAVTQAVPSWP
jgi:N-acetylglucosamine-6-phosphate deacetylase